MKILLVNRYLYRRGGDATYTLSLARLLQERGHQVICFGLDAPENDPDVNAPVLLEPIDFPGLLERGGLAAAVKVLRRTIYSREAAARMDELLDGERPDIVHLQNIHHHLSPSVIAAAARRAVPVVWTLHDFSVICPNGNLFARGRVCEECRPVRFHRMVVNRCKRASLPASAVAALESAVHRAMRLFDSVDLFIAPSRFLADKLREFDFYPGRVVHLDHFIEPADTGSGHGARAGTAPARGPGCLVYAGRLVPDKGIATLLQAASRWGRIPLKVAGDGEMRQAVVEAAARNPLVEYLGHVDGADLRGLLASSLAAVVPSVCYENQPYAVLEAWREGRPVIGAGHGGLADLLGDGERGLTFLPGDADDLARATMRLAAEPSTADRMGAAGRLLIETRFSPQAHYERLMALYDRARARGMTDAA
jgi:glycosyltransferase involved in cell wall biosynthesis